MTHCQNTGQCVPPIRAPDRWTQRHAVEVNFTKRLRGMMTISNVDATDSPGGREHVVLKSPMQRKTCSRGTQPLSGTYVFIHVRLSHTPPLLDDVPVFYALLAAVPQSCESFHLPARVPDFHDLDAEPRFELVADLGCASS
jgi:hypothetical protein